MIYSMAKKIWAPALLLVLLLLALSVTAAAAADPGKVGYPNSMASTGDSITRAFNTGPVPFTDATSNSWSTGTNGKVNSQYSRILAANSLINGKNFNDAKTGAVMADLNGQVSTAVSQNVEYVTILMGANDACASSVAAMTPVTTFRSEFQTALNTLSSGLPDARIFVASIPNIYNLWSVLHTNSAADSRWTKFKICQSMLANPTSMATADVQRRATVLQRVVDYNTQLAQVCAQYVLCRFDNNAVFNTAFPASDVSTRDFFHPNITGQATLAAGTFSATFNFKDNVAPMTAETAVPATGGVNVTLAASDNVGVAGIQYQLGASTTWVTYTGPVFVPTGTSLTYRSVDVNGNIEAAQTVTP